jgi:hypothetical protein
MSIVSSGCCSLRIGFVTGLMNPSDSSDGGSIAALQVPPMPLFQFSFQLTRGITSFLVRDLASAVEWLEHAEVSRKQVEGLALNAVHVFFRGLALLEACPTLPVTASTATTAGAPILVDAEYDAPLVMRRLAAADELISSMSIWSTGWPSSRTSRVNTSCSRP